MSKKIDDLRAEVRRMDEAWKLPRALMGGTRAMRAAGKAYLPQEPAESETSYKNRLSRAVLLNEYSRNLRTLSGYVFSRTLEFKADGDAEAALTTELEEIVADVDRDGTPLEEFAQTLFEIGSGVGLAHILVDMPSNAGDGSREAQRALRVRPYFALIRPECLLGWQTASVNGQTVLTGIRYKTSREGPNENTIEQIRHRYVTGAETSEELVYEKDRGGEWIVVDTVPIGIGKITLATFYADRSGFLTAKPPFEDLAHMNLRWWQSYADQINILHVSRVPILFGKELTPGEDGEVVVGAGALVSGGATSDLKYVEHGGAAVEAGRKDLADIEERMARLSIETYTTKRTSAATATAAGIDAKQAMSLGQLLAVNLGQALTKAIEFAAEWMGQEFNGAVAPNTEFGLRQADQATVVALNAARDRGDLSRRDYLEQLSRIRVVEDLDYEANDDRLDLEAGEALEGDLD